MDWLGVTTLAVAASGGLRLAMKPRSDTAAVLLVGGWWAAFVILGYRFVTVDLSLVEVARYTRDELSWPLRLAGTWAGANGSILMWFTFVITTVAFLTREHRRVLGLIGAIAAVLVVIVARPFATLAEPALGGTGLNPVLEHWAMAVHPPLLYTAQALVLVSAWRATSRRLALVAATVLVAATMLGSWWAHDELGWGGWWAWDPVENTALAPLVAVLASLHTRSVIGAVRWRFIAAAAVLSGIAVTRSGLPDSVHAFASGGTLAIFFLLTASAVVVLTVRARIEQIADVRSAATQDDVDPDDPAPHDMRRRPRPTPGDTGAVIMPLTAAWVLIVVGSAAVASLWLGTRDPVGVVNGRLLGRLLVPVGVVTVLGVIGFGIRRGLPRPAVLTHLGVLVFAVGVLGSLAGSTWTGNARIGEPIELGGRRIELRSVTVDDSRADITRADVVVSIDGHTTVASIIDHPDIGRTRARPSRLVDPTGETELTVTMLDSEGALVVLRRHPGLPYVWLGSGVVVLGLLAAAFGATAQREESPPLRFARLAASSESSDDPLDVPSDGAGGDDADVDGAGDGSSFGTARAGPAPLGVLGPGAAGDAGVGSVGGDTVGALGDAPGV